jgi:hypothetical protein
MSLVFTNLYMLSVQYNSDVTVYHKYDGSPSTHLVKDLQIVSSNDL